MNKDLVIVFVKNIKLGKVKTRLAKTIGDQAAYEVYKELVNITKQATKTLEIPSRIYFSDALVEHEWGNAHKAVQQGSDLGERMKNAFLQGFSEGYERIVLIGSDLPDINTSHIVEGLEALKQVEVVFGPAEDGGYYLIGLSKMNHEVFDNKPWSQRHLLSETLSELQQNNTTFRTLEVLNDIDTFEDLETSNFYKNNLELQHKIKQLND